MLNTKAEIMPNHSLGGCYLRTPLQEIQQEVLGLGLYRAGTYEMRGPFETSYRFDEFALRISVDPRNGKVFKVCALPGYLGTLFSSIHVGMLAGDAMALDLRLFYNELEEVVFVRDCPGIVLDVGGGDPQPEKVPHLPIVAICVFAPEAFTGDGQKGFW